MNKLTIPAILAATVMVAGIFAFMPVEQASTVHTTSILPGTTGIACATEDVAALATADNDIITYTFAQSVIVLSALTNADASLAGDTLTFDVISVDGGASVFVAAGTATTDTVSTSYGIEQELIGVGIQNTLALTINSATVDVNDVISFTFCVLTSDPANFDNADITTATTPV